MLKEKIISEIIRIEGGYVNDPSDSGGETRYGITKAVALENNYTPSTLILDAPLVLEQGIDLKMWKPQNYGKKFYGPSTLRMGLEKSRNLMTVRIAQNLGLKKIVNFSITPNDFNFFILLKTATGVIFNISEIFI